MARRKTSTRENTAREIQAQEAQQAPEVEILDRETETIERLEAALSDAGGAHDWKIRVNEIFQTREGAWKEGWAFNADVGEIASLRERIAQECGPGRYRCRVLRDGMPFKQYDLEIRLTLAQRRQAKDGTGALPAPLTPAATAGEPVMAQILAGLQRGQEALSAALAAIAAKPAGPSMTDLLAQMKIMREMMPEPAAPNVGFDMFMKAFTVAKELVGEGGNQKGSTLYDVLERMAGPLMDNLPKLMQAAQPAAPAPATLPQVPQHQPAPFVPPQAPAAAPAERMAQADALKRYLVGEAAKGTDPSMCVDFLMENMPPEMNEALLQADDPLSLVLQVIPEAVPHRAWFGALLDQVFEPIEPDAPNQVRTNGAAANSP